MKAAIVGRRGLGGVQMRAAPLASAFGIPFIDTKDFRGGNYDTILVCKYWPKNIRQHCNTLVFDALDCWESTHPEMSISEFWNWCYIELQFDVIIATSSSCAHKMQEVLGNYDVTVVISPHHADPRIHRTWGDPRGPIVYAGGERFIASEKANIERAAKRIGRRVVFDHSKTAWKSLQGASLAISARFPPTDTMLNRWCKPAVKIENAAAAGVCCVASDHPANWQRRQSNLSFLYTAGEDGESWAWEDAFRVAYERGPLSHPIVIENHIESLRGLLT